MKMIGSLVLSVFISSMALPVAAQNGSDSGTDAGFNSRPPLGPGFAARRRMVPAQKDDSLIKQPSSIKPLFPESSAPALSKRNTGQAAQSRFPAQAGKFRGRNGQARSFQNLLGPEGRKDLGNGTQMTRDDVSQSLKVQRKDGLGFEQKTDGTCIFKRSNGLETVRTPDGKIYMRDSKTGQPSGREIIK